MRLTSQVKRQVLSNGLTLLVERNTSAPVVAAVTHVKAGYFDEPDEWVGIAHVLEHMFFKGTARRPPGEIARETQLLGGYLNAGTIYDKTIYYTVLPSMEGALERALDIQADALMHSALDGDELKRELEVIIQEAKRKLDNPHAVATETLYELLYAQHRIRRWRIGTEAGLRRLTRDDVCAYYKTRYTPDRSIVALVGDLDVEHTLDIAASVYEGWANGQASTDRSPAETNPPPCSMRLIRSDVARPMAVLGWRTVDALSPDALALDVVSYLLGGGRGSWLYRGVREPGLASSARASHYTPTSVGVFDILLEGDAERIDDAVSRTLELVARLADPGPDEIDMERVRSLIAMHWSRRLEAMDQRAALLCEFEALGDYGLAEEFHRNTLEVTAADVCAAVETYLRPGEVSAVLSLAEGMKSRFERSTWPLRPVGTQGVARVSLSRDEPPEPAPGAVTHPPHKRFPEETGLLALPGADLLVRPKRGSGLVSVGAYAPRLRELEDSQTAGVSALVTRASVRGAGELSGEELAIRAEMLGGSIMPAATLEGVGWGMTVRAAALREAAELLLCIASDATLAADDLAVERRLQMSDAARLHDDMFRYPIRRVLEEAFPNSPYGLPSLGEPENIGALDDELVRGWAEELRTRRLVVVAVGDLDTTSLFEALTPFDAWPAADPVADGSGEPRWEPSRGGDTRQKAQSAMAMAFPASPYSSPQRFPTVVLAALLSGLAGRLFEALRERRSLAYTVAAMPWLRARAGAMLTYIATSPDREDEARDGMLLELERVGMDEITDAELDRARNYAAGAVQLRKQSARAVAGELVGAWLHNELDVLDQEASRLRAVTREELQKVSSTVFQAEQRAEFIVRGTGGGR
jgi:zinc protease